MPLTTSQKKRKVLEGFQGKTNRPNKKFRKQRQYHSSGESDQDDSESTDFKAVDLAESDEEVVKATPEKSNQKASGKADSETKPPSVNEDERSESNAVSDADDDDDDEYADSDDSAPSTTAGQRSVPKRNDPSAFSTSISKILATKLPTSARADPVLSRSKTATQTTSQIAEDKLDNQARAKLRAEKKEELDRGRVRDVRGLATGQAGAVAEEEKRLRKIAQRGVVKLFNAVRAAQVRGEEAAREERKKGTVGMGEREKTVNDVSKQGFLELISGKKGKTLNIEEA
ncbi:Rrp15p-domain-containing protein [Aspergillus crustosus]